MLSCLVASALAQTADFDTLAEGFTTTALVDGGLTFTNLDNRGLTAIPGPMSIERADGTLAGLPGFTPANALGFGGYSPGAGGAFGRFGAVEITGASPGGAASLHVYENGNPGLVLTLDALSGGVVVATDAVALSGGFGVVEHPLSVAAGSFDTLRLWVGPNPTDAAFLLVDHVTWAAAAGGSGAHTGGGGQDTGIDVSETGAVDTDTSGAPDHTGAAATGGTAAGPTGGTGSGRHTGETDTDVDADTDADTDTDGGRTIEDSGQLKGDCACDGGAGRGSVAALGGLGLLVRRRRSAVSRRATGASAAS